MDLTKKICNAAINKMAENVTVIDVSKMTVIADEFIICGVETKAQVRAICDNIERELMKEDVKPFKIDGYSDARWVVMDYGDILVHVFYNEDRQFYNLERLWNNGSNTYVFKEE